MKTNDLRHGNYFTFIGKEDLMPTERENILQLGAINDMEADEGEKFADINLTEEWLIAFEFTKFNEEIDVWHIDDVDETMKEYELWASEQKLVRYTVAIFSIFPMCTFGVNRVGDDGYALKRIQYVHELQNIMYELTGKELKLVQPY